MLNKGTIIGLERDAGRHPCPVFSGIKNRTDKKMKKTFLLFIIVFFALFTLCAKARGEDDLAAIALSGISENSFTLYLGTIKTINNLFEESGAGSKSTIQDSCNNDIGLLSINQASGSMNSQSNNAIITFQSEGDILNISSDILGVSTGNKLKITGTSSRESLICNSFSDAKGVFMINQSPGNLNQQSNVFILSIGKPVVLAEQELSMVSSDNAIEYDKDASIERKDVLMNSFTNSSGVGIISQSSGDLNIIQNTVAISVSREVIR